MQLHHRIESNCQRPPAGASTPPNMQPSKTPHHPGVLTVIVFQLTRTATPTHPSSFKPSTAFNQSRALLAGSSPAQKLPPNSPTKYLTFHLPPQPPQHGPPHPPRPLRQKARPLLQHRRRARPVPFSTPYLCFYTQLTHPQHSPQLAPPRSPRHLRPKAEAPAARRHARPALERHPAGRVARAVLGGCGRAAERYGVAAAEHGGDSGAAV